MYQEYATGPMDSLRVNRTARAAEFPRPEERPWGTGSPDSFAFTADANSIRRFSEMASRLGPSPQSFPGRRGSWFRIYKGYRSSRYPRGPAVAKNMFEVLTPGSIPGVLNEGKSAPFPQEAVCQRRPERQR